MILTLILITFLNWAFIVALYVAVRVDGIVVGREDVDEHPRGDNARPHPGET
jgi:hypothetical protein